MKIYLRGCPTVRCCEKIVNPVSWPLWLTVYIYLLTHLLIYLFLMFVLYISICCRLCPGISECWVISHYTQQPSKTWVSVHPPLMELSCLVEWTKSFSWPMWPAGVLSKSTDIFFLVFFFPTLHHLENPRIWFTRFKSKFSVIVIIIILWTGAWS